MASHHHTPQGDHGFQQEQHAIYGLNASARNFTSSSTRTAAEIQDDIELQVEMDHVDSLDTPFISALDRGTSRVSQNAQKIRTP